ncbi:hypothetical protein AB0L33_24230 [Streptomyces sp. NPDC052299]|uniref:hypothetical protein n=1 Tax=Streptomyces sp. NPDC052299 TaxID=3155054 RepID=UPI003429B6B0
MARIQGPEAQCLCNTLTAQYDRLKRRMRELKGRHKHAETWWHALRAAVDAHPDKRSFLTDTQRRFGR